MKRFVRTGFELMMEQEQTEPRDLYPRYIVFSRHFPAQERQMRHALEQAIESSENKEELAQVLDVCGEWIITAVTETFPAVHTGSE